MTAIIAACISSSTSIAAVVLGFWLNQRATREHITRVTEQQTAHLVKTLGTQSRHAADPDRWEGNPAV